MCVAAEGLPLDAVESITLTVTRTDNDGLRATGELTQRGGRKSIIRAVGRDFDSLSKDIRYWSGLTVTFTPGVERVKVQVPASAVPGTQTERVPVGAGV